MRILKFFCAVIFLVLCLNAKCTYYAYLGHNQICLHCYPSTTTNTGLLLETKFQKKISKYFKGEINLQTRVMDNFGTISALMPEVGISAKLHKFFSLKTCYRYNFIQTSGSRIYGAESNIGINTSQIKCNSPLWS
ncbi:MAG: hypothetical protein COC01_09700 [Bacteroidetes bacterium]|nr:MAG: hypothetical protein COC01_09700 [Bacteroidota bacterium]